MAKHAPQPLLPPTPEEIAACAAKQERAEAQILEQMRRIDFYLTEYSVELLANKMKEGEFIIPQYQREDTWEPARKSRFIESLLMACLSHFFSSGSKRTANWKLWTAPSDSERFTSSCLAIWFLRN